MNLRENVLALMRAQEHVGPEVVADLIIAAVEAQMIRRQREQAAIAGRLGGRRSGDARTTAPPEGGFKGASRVLQGGLNHPSASSGQEVLERDPDPDLEKRAEKIPDPDPVSCAEPALLEFPVIGKRPGPWPLTASVVSGLEAAFPGVDVMAECRKSLEWVKANAANRKTYDGMRKFLFGWVNRACNKGIASRHGAAGRTVDVSRGHVRIEAGASYPVGEQKL